MMYQGKSRYYWWCQVIGWGIYGLADIDYAFTFNRSLNLTFFTHLIALLLAGILVTHVLRMVIIRFNWLQLDFNKALVFRFLIAVILGGAVCMAISHLVDHLIHFSVYSRPEARYLAGIINDGSLIFSWGVIYFLWHFMEKIRSAQMDRLRLESTVKELELKTIKSQLNPHFIFNALNSIRALIDENPGRARTAITELSNILRSSLQAEKAETVSLQNEIGIVKDYLALENIRFEERLKTEFDIDSDTLDLPIPPLMLQTLVENAIKHGISKTVKGGLVHIASRISGNNYEITIRNTGHLGRPAGRDGFGLQSTRQRLDLLFGGKASFRIYDTPDQLVEARVTIPLELVRFHSMEPVRMHL
jgi:two-component system LytT family sensor kinase